MGELKASVCTALFAHCHDGLIHGRVLFQDGAAVDYEYLKVNPAWCALMSAPDPTGKKLSELFPGIRQRDPEVLELCGRVVRTGVAEHVLRHNKTLDRWFALSLFKADEDEFVASFEDVTATRRVDPVTSNIGRETAAHLATLLRTSPAAVLVSELESGRLLQVNGGFCTFFGWQEGEVIGRTTAELRLYVDPADRTRLYEDLARKGRSDTREVRVRTRAGEARVVSLHAIRAELAGERRAVGVMFDVTKQHDLSSQLATLFRIVQAAIVVTRASDERILEVNPLFTELLGWSREEAVGRTTRELGFDAKADAERPREVRVRARDGHDLMVSMSVATVELDGQRCTIGVMHDVTALREADLATRETEARFRRMFDDSAIGLAILDPTASRWAHVNGALARMLGYESEELVGREWQRVAHPDDWVKGTRARQEALAGRTYRQEKRYIHKDGHVVWARVTLSPIKDREGRVEALAAVIEDISSAKLVEDELLQVSERNQLALEAARLGTMRRDLATGEIRTDARARSHYGIETDGPIRLEDLQRRCHPDDRAHVANVIAAARAQGHFNTSVDHRVVLPNGEVRWVSMHTTTIFKGEGDARRAVFELVATRDITDQKRSEQALVASEAKYRALVENLDDVIFSLDVTGTITFVSPAIRRFGYEPSELVGRKRGEFVHVEDQKRLKSDPGDGRAYEWRLMDKSGKPRPVRSTTRPLKDGDVTIGYTGVVVDQTAQRAVEDELRAAQKMEAIGRLAGGIAHDFNNLLSVILAYSETSLDELPADSALRDELQTVAEAGRRGAELTRQLLAFSRRQVFDLQRIDVNDLVSGVTRMLRRIISEDISFSIVAAPTVPPIRADRGQLEQVLINLFVNARDAMPDGGRIVITTAAASLEASRAQALGIGEGSYAEISITDSGVGMDDATRTRIFEPFFTTKPAGKGTGLGLSTAYGIIKQSGGAIEVESAPSAGACFRIYLPVDVASLAAPLPPRHDRESLAGRETVLVVEDEPALREVVARVLSRAGYRTLVATDVADASAIAEREGKGIDLVLTDIVMPELNGQQLVARLRAITPRAEVLYMSGYADVSLDLPPTRVLMKPFDRSTLLGKVRATLDARTDG